MACESTAGRTALGDSTHNGNAAHQRVAAIRKVKTTRDAVLPFESPADEIYGSIRTQLEPAGTPIGGSDLLIGAPAIALDHMLVTDNDREFAHINGLRVMACASWLARRELGERLVTNRDIH